MGQVTDTREKLLSSTLELMHARSYGDVGVQELCEHAGVKKGSFYHFFPSKRDLVLEAMEQQWNQTKRLIQDQVLSSKLSPMKQLERCFEIFYEAQCASKAKTGRVHGCPFGNLAIELSTQDEGFRKKMDGIFREFSDVIEGLLREAQTAGEIAVTNVGATAQALVVSMEGIMLLAKTRNDPAVIKELGQVLVRNMAVKPSRGRNGGKAKN